MQELFKSPFLSDNVRLLSPRTCADPCSTPLPYLIKNESVNNKVKLTFHNLIFGF